MSFKVVVTGASGFIGTALLSQLEKDKIHVTGLSRQVKKGLTTVASYADYPSSADTILVHLAQPRDAYHPSNGDELNLCEALALKSWLHVVYISSSIVYGDEKQYPRKPDETVISSNEYANVKLKCEAIVDRVGGTSLRLANIFGPGMAPNSVISDILNQIPGEGPIVVRDKSKIRDFLWIEDVVNAITKAVMLQPGGILNLGSGRGVSIEVLAEQALNLAGEKNRLVFSQAKMDLSSCLILDISQTRSKLKWSPEWDLHRGLSYLLKTKINNE